MKTGIIRILCLAFLYPFCNLPTAVASPVFSSHQSSIVPDTNIVLPVRWVSFTAVNTEQGVDLRWVTLHEQLTQSFVVERSQDGKQYKQIGQLSAAHTSYSDKRYNFFDLNPKPGLNFYRIKQVDFDGAFTYSKVVFVDTRNSGSDKIKAFPNPIVGNEPIQLSGINTADLTKGNIRVFNVTGSSVNYRMAGTNAIQLDENAPTGLYIIRVLDQSIRIIKK